jgi:hypothetical protein
MIYKILETDKRSDRTRMLAYFAEKDAAYRRWREIAWQHVDDAHLWHRLVSEDVHPENTNHDDGDHNHKAA